MTRKEEIRNAIDELIPIHPSKKGRTYQQLLIANGFKAGVVWADEHPVNVWHDASEEPLLDDKEIIFLNEQDIAYISERFGGTFTYMLEELSWERFVELLRISKWAYIDDLLPKESVK